MAETEEREQAPDTDEQDREASAGGEESAGGDKSEQSASEAAQQHEEEREQAKEEMRELEESDEVPKKLEDWPGGKAKYETYGGAEGEKGYDEAATAKLGPSSLRHHEDGEVSIEGEKVDDPDEYKGEPIPGGPSDPNTDNEKENL